VRELTEPDVLELVVRGEIRARRPSDAAPPCDWSDHFRGTPIPPAEGDLEAARRVGAPAGGRKPDDPVRSGTAVLAADAIAAVSARLGVAPWSACVLLANCLALDKREVGRWSERGIPERSFRSLLVDVVEGVEKRSFRSLLVDVVEGVESRAALLRDKIRRQQQALS